MRVYLRVGQALNNEHRTSNIEYLIGKDKETDLDFCPILG